MMATEVVTKTWVKKPICEKFLYMIGVPAQYIDHYDDLNKGALSEVRKLCSLRSMIIANFTDINDKFRKGEQLSEMKETARYVADVAKFGVVIENKSSLSRNVMELNELIDQHVFLLAKGFKNIPEEWVRDIFHMPEGDSVDGVRTALRRYRQFKNCYPYQKYVNWPFAEMTDEQRSRNIFRNDEDLIELLSEIHANKSSQLMDFIGTHDDLVIVVDCENSDPQRLYNSLRPMQSFIKKIILIDDAHTNMMWDELVADFRAANVVVEHDELARLKEQKSLVDMRMVAKTCEEHWKNGVKHFILATSDSDIWALISSMPDADIMVLAEKCKCGDVLIEALSRSGVQRVFMEDIVEDSTELMDKLMAKRIAANLSKRYLDVRGCVYDAARQLNLFLDREAMERYVADTMSEVYAVKDVEGGRITAAMD